MRTMLLLQTDPIYAYLPIVVLLFIAILFPVLVLGIGRLLRPMKPEAPKLSPYECGVEPVLDARERFSVRYYIIAMLFLIFDVETVFLFPWAVIYDKLALFGLIEMAIFLGLLIVGYYYAWRKGALEWT
ncbi:MAG: NADH-quinone oxidoreductase subunit A [Acidobacteriota bacterium]|nr:NADH-quinone oxidoreductase subunit A [Acidobacteriota bacterium]MDW8255586.1 NADH-quinone oxidoreductase subunit A [Acidobacteriota bacterium]